MDATKQRIEQLFRECDKPLQRYLSRRFGSSEEMRDIVQDAFVHLLSRGESIALVHAQAYLYRTAVNLAINRGKQLAVRKKLDALNFAIPPEEYHTPQAAVETHQQLYNVATTLSRLPDHCARAFKLVMIDGVGVLVAAQMLGIGHRTVRRLVERASASCQLALTRSAHVA